jgi:hypothetical protein
VNYAGHKRHRIVIYSYLFKEMHYSISELIFFIKTFQPKHGKFIKYSEADKVNILEISQANDAVINLRYFWTIYFISDNIYILCLSHSHKGLE